MKAKITFTDEQSGRSINLICKERDIAWIKDRFDYSHLTENQRKKMEKFFGKERAYHTEVENIKTMRTAEGIYREIMENGGSLINAFRSWTDNELVRWLYSNSCETRAKAEKIAYWIKYGKL